MEVVRREHNAPPKTEEGSRLEERSVIGGAFCSLLATSIGHFFYKLSIKCSFDIQIRQLELKIYQDDKKYFHRKIKISIFSFNFLKNLLQFTEQTICECLFLSNKVRYFAFALRNIGKTTFPPIETPRYLFSFFSSCFFNSHRKGLN